MGKISADEIDGEVVLKANGPAIWDKEQVVTPCHNRTLKSGCTSSSRRNSDEGFSQRNHHATSSFQDQYRRLCEKHGIEIDERYVWD